MIETSAIKRIIPAGAPPHLHLRVALVLVLVGLSVLGAALALSFESGSLFAQLDALEVDVQSALSRLASTQPRNAGGGLRRLRRVLGRRQRRLARAAGGPEAAEWEAAHSRKALTEAELERLMGKVDGWESRLQNTTVSQREAIWINTLVEVLHERTRWPLGGVLRPPSRYPMPRILWTEFRQGVQIGAMWPVFGLERGLRGRPAHFGVLRRLLFPYTSHSLRLSHLLGVGFASVVVGYGLCWIGKRFNRAWASYAGLLYLVYTIIFSASFLCLRLGVLA
jgi:hypothetical protein